MSKIKIDPVQGPPQVLLTCGGCGYIDPGQEKGRLSNCPKCGDRAWIQYDLNEEIP